MVADVLGDELLKEELGKVNFRSEITSGTGRTKAEAGGDLLCRKG